MILIEKKGRVSYGIYVLRGSREQVGHFRTEGAKAVRGEPHTGRFKARFYVVNTKGRKETQRQTDKKGKRLIVVIFQ